MPREVEQLLSVAGVASRLAVSPRTVRGWLAQARRTHGAAGLPSVALTSRCVRIRESAIARFLRDRELTTP